MESVSKDDGDNNNENGIFLNSIFIQGHLIQQSQFKWSPDTTQKQRYLKNMKTKQLSYKDNMYRRRYCLKWRLSLILNSPRVLQVRAPFILKLPWHLVVFLYISQPSLHDCDMELPNFMRPLWLYEVGESSRKVFFLFFLTQIRSFRIQPQRISPTFNILNETE